MNRSEDVYGGSINLGIGPLNIQFSYNIGCPDELFGLSETEAWDRATRYESNRNDGSSPNNPAPLQDSEA
jgi:hypothetical protein